LAECRLLISQHEARMQTLTESMKEAETRKRALEEDVDALREECAKLKAAEQVQAVTNKEKAEEKEAATKMRVALEEQMDQLRDAHQKQVAYLWNTFQLDIGCIFSYIFNFGFNRHFLDSFKFFNVGFNTIEGCCAQGRTVREAGTDQRTQRSQSEVHSGAPTDAGRLRTAEARGG